MDREGSKFAFFQKFPRINMEKFKTGIFDGPQIRELMKDPMFDEALNEAELSPRKSLKSVVTNFLENHQRVEYEKVIGKLLNSFCQLGARMSVKLQFLWSYLDYFPKNCGDLSEEQGEYFHQDTRIIKELYQDRWDVNVFADYCWCLKRNAVAAEHRWKCLKRPFMQE